MAEIRRALASHRLVTLTGAGGVGKTRLAVEATRTMFENGDAPADGIWLVELATVSDGDLLPRRLAMALRLPPSLGQLTPELLCDELRDKAMLVVLDNCEHLVEACAGLIEKLLQRCWELRVLATSREALRVPGERVIRAPSLSLPDNDDCGDGPSESARLFIQRVRDVRDGFEPSSSKCADIVRICRALDGIPLALELAASQARTLPLGDIAAALDRQMKVLSNGHRTAIPRHRSMRNAIQWSYDLLAPAEQTLFVRLAVFVGGWTSGAARAVCGNAALPADDVPATLQHLVEKSLVVADTTTTPERFRMLEPVRQFALDMLRDSGEVDTLRRAHAVYFVELAVETEAVYFGKRNWRDAPIIHERANLDETLRWAQAHDVALAYRLCSCSKAVWAGVDDHYQMLRAVRLTLQIELRSPTQEMLRDKFWTFGSGGYIAGFVGEYAVASELFAQALALCQQFDDTALLAEGIRGCAYIATVRGDLAEASEGVERSLSLCRASGDAFGVVDSLYDLGVVRWMQGDVASAMSLLDECLIGLESVENVMRHALALAVMASLESDLAHFDKASSLFASSLKFQRDCEIASTCEVMEEVATLLIRLGRAADSVVMLGAAKAHRALFQYFRPPFYEARYQRTMLELRAQVSQADWNELWAAGSAMTIEQATDYALSALEAPRGFNPARASATT